MMAMKRMSTLAIGSKLSPEAQQLGQNIQQYKEESEKENVDEVRFPLFYGRPCVLLSDAAHFVGPKRHLL